MQGPAQNIRPLRHEAGSIGQNPGKASGKKPCMFREKALPLFAKSAGTFREKRCIFSPSAAEGAAARGGGGGGKGQSEAVPAAVVGHKGEELFAVERGGLLPHACNVQQPALPLGQEIGYAHEGFLLEYGVGGHALFGRPCGAPLAELLEKLGMEQVLPRPGLRRGTLAAGAFGGFLLIGQQGEGTLPQIALHRESLRGVGQEPLLGAEQQARFGQRLPPALGYGFVVRRHAPGGQHEGAEVPDFRPEVARRGRNALLHAGLGGRVAAEVR